VEVDRRPPLLLLLLLLLLILSIPLVLKIPKKTKRAAKLVEKKRRPAEL